MPEEQERIEYLIKQKKTFSPSKGFRDNAIVRDESIYKRAKRSPEAFWESFAKELHWFKKWKRVLDWKLPHSKWFVGGKINLTYNCLDRHLNTARRNKAAIIWEGENGETATWTYQQLHRQVCMFANVLKKMGIKKGDVVCIYMPMIPEIAVAMLACARIGAVHSIIFGGFSASALVDRITDASAKMVITADGACRRGTIINLKANVDEAMPNCPSVENVIVVARTEQEIVMYYGRDHWHHELMLSVHD